MELSERWYLGSYMPDEKPQQQDTINVLQITDFHLFDSPDKTLLGVDTESSLLAVLELAKRNHWPPDLVLATGDLTQDGSAQGYRRLSGYLSQLGVPVYWLPGNHDDRQAMDAHLHGEGLHQAWEVTLGNWYIILLDSSVPDKVGGCLSEAELGRLNAGLRAHADKHVLVCLHHNPVAVGSDWMANIGLDNSDAFFEILEGYDNVRAVMWGHIHQDYTRTRHGIELMATPSTCFQFTPQSRDFAVDDELPGYRWLRLAGDGSLRTGINRLRDYNLDVEWTSRGY
jgi:Icc protein